jgi:hypothetical protein
MKRSLNGSGTPGAPTASIATSRQTTQAVTDVIGRTSTVWLLAGAICVTTGILVTVLLLNA